MSRDLIANNVRVNVMGYTDKLPDSTKKAVFDAIEQTKDNTGMVLNFALNYGGRAEITTAVQAVATQVKQGKLEPSQIDEKVFQRL